MFVNLGTPFTILSYAVLTVLDTSCFPLYNSRINYGLMSFMAWNLCASMEEVRTWKHGGAVSVQVQ